MTQTTTDPPKRERSKSATHCKPLKLKGLGGMGARGTKTVMKSLRDNFLHDNNITDSLPSFFDHQPEGSSTLSTLLDFEVTSAMARSELPDRKLIRGKNLCPPRGWGVRFLENFISTAGNSDGD